MNAAKRMAGFTLLEMLLCVAIISLLVGMGTPVYAGFVQRNDLDIATQTLGSMLYRAETYARGVSNDDTWSVDIQDGSFTLFEGSTYATRDTTQDETYSVPSSISLDYSGDITFAKLTGFPNATPSMTLTSIANATRTLSINAKGMVDY